MCIANHPVLYDLHMTEVGQSCARLRPETANPRDAKPQSGGWEVGPPGYVVLTCALSLLRRILSAKGVFRQTA